MRKLTLMFNIVLLDINTLILFDVIEASTKQQYMPSQLAGKSALFV